MGKKYIELPGSITSAEDLELLEDLHRRVMAVLSESPTLSPLAVRRYVDYANGIYMAAEAQKLHEDF